MSIVERSRCRLEERLNAKHGNVVSSSNRAGKCLSLNALVMEGEVTGQGLSYGRSDCPLQVLVFLCPCHLSIFYFG